MLIGKQEELTVTPAFLTGYYSGGGSFMTVTPIEQSSDDDYCDYDDYGGYRMEGRYAYSPFSVRPGESFGDAVRRAADAGLYITGKEVRPWTVQPNFFDRLKPNSVWVGFEVEHGLRSCEDADRALRWIDANTEYASIDIEGCGDWPLELTFAPTDDRNWFRNCGPLVMIDAIERGDYPAPIHHDPNSEIGTHLNFSTRFTRSLLGSRYEEDNVDMVDMIDSFFDKIGSAIDYIDDYIRFDLFGREAVYIYSPILQVTNTGAYVECKWFNSTFNRARFYKNLVVAEWIISTLSSKKRFLEIVGKIKEVEGTGYDSWSRCAEFIGAELERIAAIKCSSAEDFERVREECKCRL